MPQIARVFRIDLPGEPHGLYLVTSPLGPGFNTVCASGIVAGVIANINNREVLWELHDEDLFRARLIEMMAHSNVLVEILQPEPLSPEELAPMIVIRSCRIPEVLDVYFGQDSHDKTRVTTLSADRDEIKTEVANILHSDREGPP